MKVLGENGRSSKAKHPSVDRSNEFKGRPSTVRKNCNLQSASERSKNERS